MVSSDSASTLMAMEASVNKYSSSSGGKIQTLSIHLSSESLELYPWKKARSLEKTDSGDGIHDSLIRLTCELCYRKVSGLYFLHRWLE